MTRLRHAAAGLLAILAVPASALADVHVSQSLSRVTVTAVASTNSAPNRLLIRPHISTANGVEVRQLGFGDPAIRDLTHDVCNTDGLANAVTCNSPTTDFDVTLGGGSETLEFGSADAHPQGCFPTEDGVATQNVQVNGDLGGGDDGLFVVSTGPARRGPSPTPA